MSIASSYLEPKRGSAGRDVSSLNHSTHSRPAEPRRRLQHEHATDMSLLRSEASQESLILLSVCRREAVMLYA